MINIKFVFSRLNQLYIMWKLSQKIICGWIENKLIMVTKLNLSLLTITCIIYTLIFDTLSIMNFGRSLSALQTVAYPKIATFFAALISLITIRLAITSKNYLGGRERLLLAVLILFWGYTVIGNNFHGARISLQAILFPLTMFGLVLSSEYNQILRAIAFFFTACMHCVEFHLKLLVLVYITFLAFVY